MSGETLEYKIIVDAAQAQIEVDKFKDKLSETEPTAKKTATAVDLVDKKIAMLTKDMVDLAHAMSSNGPNSAAYVEQMRRINKELDAMEGKHRKVSESTQKFSSVTTEASHGTRNVGMAALEASRAFEDLQYGLGGVVNNIPSLVMSLGGTAGLTAVISLTAVGINQLVKNFGAMDPAAKEAATAAKEHVKKLRDEIEGLQVDLRVLEVGARRAAMEQQAKKIEEAAKEAAPLIDAIGRETFDRMMEQQRQGFKRQGSLFAALDFMSADVATREKMKKAGAWVSEEAFQAAVAAQEKLDLELSKMAGMVRKQNEEDAQHSVDLAVDRANAITEIEQKASKDQEKLDRYSPKALQERIKAGIAKEQEAADQRYAIYQAELKAEEDQERAARVASEKRIEEAYKEEEKAKAKAEEDRQKAAEKHASRLVDIEGTTLAQKIAYDELLTQKKLENLDKLSDAEWKKLKQSAQQNAQFYQNLVDLVDGATTSAINLTNDYFAMKIEGAENAEAIVGAKFISGIGDQLVAQGTKHLLGGTADALMGDPRGPGLMAIGGAEIAAGLGMGAAGAAWAHTTAGGTVGQPLPDKTGSKDRGASPRSSRGGGGDGGPLVINVSYGVGGPLPEDTAREIARVMRTGDRRRGA